MIALRKETPLVPAGLSHEFLAFIADQATAEIVCRVCESQGLSGDGIIPGSLDDAIDGLSTIATPSLLVVDLGHSQDIMADAARLAEVCDAGARVILLGEINDLRLYRDVLAAGVADYLVKPFQDADLARSFERARPPVTSAVSAVSQPASEAKADCVCVIGVRGGVGASTIAANAAWFVAGELQKSVTLIDMDLTFGTQALILDVDPGNGLCDAMGEPGRMDELFVKRASVTLNERFRVLASETDPSRGELANAAAFNGLLEYVRDDTDLVIVDLPRTLVIAQPEILQSFTRAILIAEPGLAAMRDSVRLSTLIKAVNPNAVISVVLSRQGIAPKEELSQKTFEDGAGLKIATVIPFDARTAMRAEAGGKCILQTARRSKLGKALAGVAQKIAGADPLASAKPLFGFLKRASKAQANGKGI